jgi:hypothetical protein
LKHSKDVTSNYKVKKITDNYFVLLDVNTNEMIREMDSFWISYCKNTFVSSIGEKADYEETLATHDYRVLELSKESETTINKILFDINFLYKHITHQE